MPFPKEALLRDWKFKCSVLCALAHRFTKRMSPILRMLRKQKLSVTIVACFFIVAFSEEILKRISISPFVNMQSLFICILPFLFIISAIALSIPSSLSLTTPKPDTLSPPLSLINLNSTGLNFSNLTSRVVNCNKRLGQDLVIGSCRNAWQKIHPTQHVQRVWPRPNQFHHHDIRPGDLVTPFRYLSDDGLCAIVRCLLSTSPPLFSRYSTCARSNKWPRKFTLKNMS